MKQLPMILLLCIGSVRANAQFLSSNLPVIVLETGGINIPDEPKINAKISIYDRRDGQANFWHTDVATYEGIAGIELRGASSQGFDQRSYTLELRDSSGMDLDTSILGLPAESDFILRAPYADKSLFRDIMAYRISNDMGVWAPQTRLCELVVNGDYEGVYVFLEKIKRSKNRLDLAKLTENDLHADDVTGGYIVKVDRWGLAPGWYNFSPDNQQQLYLHYVYPQGEDIQPEQEQYIQRYLDSFELALTLPGWDKPNSGWRAFADENSFIDHFLINELTRNVDAYRLSGFYHKDKNGKLKAGPAWDFNFSMRNGDYCNAQYAAGWTYEVCDGGVPWWWFRMLKDTAFTNRMRCRWETLRTSVLTQDHLFHVIDSMRTLTQAAQQRHFNRWPILGQYVWPNPEPLAQTHLQEVEAMKQWLYLRLYWMDYNVPGLCGPRPKPLEESTEWQLLPIPANDHLTLINQGRPPAGTNLEVFDLTGKLIFQTEISKSVTAMPVEQWQSGLYVVLLRDWTGKIVLNQKVVVFR